MKFWLSVYNDSCKKNETISYSSLIGKLEGKFLKKIFLSSTEHGYGTFLQVKFAIKLNKRMTVFNLPIKVFYLNKLSERLILRWNKPKVFKKSLRFFE